MRLKKRMQIAIALSGLLGTVPYMAFSQQSLDERSYWIEYWPSHKVSVEGRCEDGENVGLFRYYSNSGHLIRKEGYR